MLESLSAKLQKILRNLKGEGRIFQHHIEESMRELRIALLEADVHFKVVKEFVSRVQEKALGQEVLRSLTPGQHMVKIFRDELNVLLGGKEADLAFAKVPPTVILLVGLQGSGKTTTTGKLALWLRKKGHRPLMVSTDVHRPAAREQLSIIGKAIDLPVFEEGNGDPAEIAGRAFKNCQNAGFDVLLIDTAGRLHVDNALMDELEQIRVRVPPQEILLVTDAMTGQDAVNSATEFDRRLNLSGVILTKMDGDSRGGASLSIVKVTGKSIKFIGVGEKYHALEVFHPDRMASRILGMGDVLGLVEKAEKAMEETDALDMLERMRRDQFSLEDFRDQLRQIQKLGPLEQIQEMLPQFKGAGKIQVDEKELLHLEAIINSMTPRERNNYKILTGSRRKRIALGSGQPVSKVNRLIKQYLQARRVMKQVSKGFFHKKLPKLNFPF